ncbi:hypothetical protein BAY60_19725 [Prauserella muralis]|uniref:Flagellar biosynthetic protein FliP n=2 Tax=Prauserella muralis TaxID=588067 RepID=A0A2V4AQA1_9PSEU|nr:hypothetical protein BAY60_19725 [Prauserella muralis]
MSIAMGLGMAILGPLVRWGFSAAGWSAVFDHTDARAMVMATEMAVAMAGWMWFRRHSRGSIVEMTLAMYLPFVVLLPPYWAGVVSGGALMGIGHGVMLLAMAALVYRRRHEHTAHAAAPSSPMPHSSR